MKLSEKLEQSKIDQKLIEECQHLEVALQAKIQEAGRYQAKAYALEDALGDEKCKKDLVSRVADAVVEKLHEQQDLWKVCEKFIQDNEILCQEHIYQCDNVCLNALPFIESICNIVGYETYTETDEE